MAETLNRDTKAKLEVMTRFDEEALKFDFERTAAGYRLRHRLVKSLFVKEYKTGAIALDLGCGTGEYTISLAQAGFQVVGGDFSKSMLTVARSKILWRKELSEKIQLIRLESTRLPFRSEFFDAITCIVLLDWVPDSLRLLDEVNRVLKHQAKLIICVDALWSPYRIYRKMQLAIGHQKRYACILNSRELQHTLAACGFVVKKFFGDVLLAQVITRLLFDPKATALADKVLKATQPFDRHLTNLPLIKYLSAHYIIEARKK